MVSLSNEQCQVVKYLNSLILKLLQVVQCDSTAAGTGELRTDNLKVSS